MLLTRPDRVVEELASIPELAGVPVAVWALVIACFSFMASLTALGWQVLKHFLDGGRVKVYLNTAIWQPEVMLLTSRSGKLFLEEDASAKNVTHAEALELAQLVVENPGRTPVTIYSPGLSLSGHGKKKHSISPRMLATGDSYGPDKAVADQVVRLEPYARVTFLFDYWGLMPRLLNESPSGQVTLRGHVGVAGRTNRSKKSRRKNQWRIEQGMYTAIKGSPAFTPLAVIWREMYLRLPERVDGEAFDHPVGKFPITRDLAHDILDDAMSRFEFRPEREELKDALKEIEKDRGVRIPMLGTTLLEGYAALDGLEGHLTEWTEGLTYRLWPGWHPESRGVTQDN